MPDPFEVLSIDILRLICLYLDPTDLEKFCKSSPSVYACLSTDHVVWNYFLKKHFDIESSLENGEEARGLYQQTYRDLVQGIPELSGLQSHTVLSSLFDATQKETINQLMAWVRQPFNEKLQGICQSYRDYLGLIRFLSTLESHDANGQSVLMRLGYFGMKCPAVIKAILQLPDYTVKIRDLAYLSVYSIKTTREIIRNHGKIDSLAVPLDLSSDPSFVSFRGKGFTTLHYLVHGNFDKATQIILSHSYPGYINQGNTHGYSALRNAAGWGHLEFVHVLLAHPDVDINIGDNWEMTPLMIAVYWHHLEVVKALVAAPRIDVNLADTFGETALQIAVERKNIEVLKVLLSHPDIIINVKLDQFPELAHLNPNRMLGNTSTTSLLEFSGRGVIEIPAANSQDSLHEKQDVKSGAYSL